MQHIARAFVDDALRKIVSGVFEHRTLPVEGVQFHPESILTGAGHDLLRNFLQRTLQSTPAPH